MADCVNTILVYLVLFPRLLDHGVNEANVSVVLAAWNNLPSRPAAFRVARRGGGKTLQVDHDGFWPERVQAPPARHELGPPAVAVESEHKRRARLRRGFYVRVNDRRALDAVNIEALIDRFGSRC